ncbi:MAG: sugar phosphate isomerase/epimerase, partial [Candidatus Limnocylindrales bacterium]
MTSAPPLAVQLYSLREAAAHDLPGVLDQVARAGFLGVEYASLHDQAPAAVRRWAGDLGLAGVGIHRRMPPGAEGERVLDEAAELGVDTVIVPWVEPQRFATDEGIAALADELAGARAQAAARGIRLGYHNHEFEPAARDPAGTTGLERLFDLAGPEVVAEVDIYWATVGGEDPAALIGRLGSRVRLLHIKDGPADPADRDAPQVAVGAGRVDVAGAIAAGSSAEWHVVELDRCATDMIEALRS